MTTSSARPRHHSYSYSLPNYDATGELPLHLVALPPLPATTTNDDDASKKEDGTPHAHAHVDMLAYGGNDGHIYLLPNYISNDSNSSESSSANSHNNGANNNHTKMMCPASAYYYPSSPILLTTYDDIPRTIAISPDGLRLAIGFDGGETRIFSYDDCCLVGGSASGDNSDEAGISSSGNVHVDKLGVRHHPFVDVRVVDRAIDRCMSGGGDCGDDVNNESGDR